MKLYVGLGNPGEEYENTRHNVGFLFLDEVSKDFEKDPYLFAAIAHEADNTLVKPQTFMNDSGKSVAAILKKSPVSTDDLYVIHDDLDLKLGEYKIQKGVGPKLHNGIESIETSIKTKDFWRIRIGIDNRDPLNRIDGETYVLQKFLPDELIVLREVFQKILHEKNISTS